jgi:hypothetical protein
VWSLPRLVPINQSDFILFFGKAEFILSDSVGAVQARLVTTLTARRTSWRMAVLKKSVWVYNSLQNSRSSLPVVMNNNLVWGVALQFSEIVIKDLFMGVKVGFIVMGSFYLDFSILNIVFMTVFF